MGSARERRKDMYGECSRMLQRRKRSRRGEADARRSFGDLVVIDSTNGKRRPLGFLTDRNIVVAVVAKEVDATTLFVTEIMTSPANAYDAARAIHGRSDRYRDPGRFAAACRRISIRTWADVRATVVL